MNYIDVKINFLHNARPRIAQSDYENLIVSYPLGAIPNEGDVIQIDDITHPNGAFIVAHRVFESRDGTLAQITLTLDTEGGD
jgi:hypothetical protein